ncbi:MAG: glycosyltransferase family 4 protein [Gammaproteobacteria bacterium]|nr:glycosyltransferase family 4 protein [Gammaproteobacteria bacterium]
MHKLRWAIVTGEYPPQPGGVSDYTRLAAQGLAQAGDEVHIWAPFCAQPGPTDPSLTVHRLPGHFGLRSLSMLDAALRDLRPHRVLVQYVPHAFGWRAMNVPFCLWLFLRRRRDPIWVMFHEVAYPLSRTQLLKHNVLGVVNRLMAFLVTRAAAKVFVSIPAWEWALRRIAPRRQSLHWLPVPSNMPAVVDPTEAAAIRAQIAPDPATVVVGHFGTFGSHVAPMLKAILTPLLEGDARCVGLLLGRGGDQFANAMTKSRPNLHGRLIAPGILSPEGIAVHLAACDVLVQPYPDGVSSRRTSMMTGLALGLPIVTTKGPLTEPLWQESRAVVLAPVQALSAFIRAADHLLTHPQDRAALRERAAALYAEKFALAHTLRALRS